MFDSHCHLINVQDSSCLRNIKNTQESSYQSFIDNPNNKFICVSTHRAEWSKVIALHDKYPNIYSLLGIHPWFVEDDWQDDLLLMQDLLNVNSIVGLGEIGLDFSKKYKSNFNHQIDCFSAQLNIAEAYSKPVSLHVIKAHNEMLTLLKSVNVNGVIHGIGSSIQIAQQYIDIGYKLGVNGVSVRDNAARYHKLISYFGIEHIVLETDFPNVTLPHHQCCELNDIETIAQFVADKLSLPLEKTISMTENNTNYIFNLSSES